MPPWNGPEGYALIRPRSLTARWTAARNVVSGRRCPPPNRCWRPVGHMAYLTHSTRKGDVTMEHVPFSLLRNYAAFRMGVCTLAEADDRPRIVPSLRRTKPEPSFSFARVLYWLRLRSGAATVSVAPYLAEAVASWISTRPPFVELPDDEQAQDLLVHVRSATVPPGMAAASVARHEIYACDSTCIVPPPSVTPPASLVRIRTAGLTYAGDIWPPEHCLPDGTAFGVMHSGKIVAVAYAHRIGTMEAQIADIGVETAADYRRRGYARACVHGVCEVYTVRGGQAWYECSPSNVPSQMLAKSVGFGLWAQSLSLVTNPIDPAPE
jgi:hypothetical protein